MKLIYSKACQKKELFMEHKNYSSGFWVCSEGIPLAKPDEWYQITMSELISLVGRQNQSPDERFQEIT